MAGVQNSGSQGFTVFFFMCIVQKIQVCDKTFTEEVGFFERISSTLRSLALSVKSYGVLALRFVERVGNPNVVHSTSQRVYIGSVYRYVLLLPFQDGDSYKDYGMLPW